jgi:hypothetical protein
MADEKPIGKPPSEDSDIDLLEHVKALGLGTVEEYVAWCVRHGFSRRTAKNARQRLRERSFATRAVADARLAQKKKELRGPEKVLEGIFRGELDEDQVTQPYLKAVCRACKLVPPCDRTRQAFRELLLHAGKYADLASLHPVIPEFGRQVGNTFLGGLLALAGHADHWVRSVGDWRPKTHNSRRQFSALARHLVAHWPVPAFMDSVWFKGGSEDGLRQQRWFLHLGRGENIRTADLPLPFTRRMAHHFMQAPAELTVEAALRWGQIHALGGKARLVRAIIGTRLGTNFADDDFWTTVLHFFIAHPMLDTVHVGPIIDFIHHQRFVPQEVLVAPGVVQQGAPPQPTFSMKGRTPASLLRLMGVWHRTLASVQQLQAGWCPSGIDGFEFTEGSERGGNLKLWTITELLDTRALVAEGRAMKHCVATYARSCAQGLCSIWALEATTFEGRSRVLTVEVQNRARLICQARGKGNTLPADKHRNILRRWADQAGLRLASYV